jgi:hypothetical protein
MTRFWTLLSILLFAVVVGGTAIALFYLSQTQPPAMRTWVSGAGSDTSVCSRDAPCQTFARALARTASGGEINCLDNGGFGTITIVRSVTIDCTNALASIHATARDATGVVVSAAGVKVTLRNISINGGGTGLNGVRVSQSAEVNIENCRIEGLTEAGIALTIGGTGGTAKLNVLNTVVSGGSRGIQIETTAGSVTASLYNVHISGTSAAVQIGANAYASIDRAALTGNSVSAVLINGPAGTAYVSNSDISHNAVGVSVAVPTGRAFLSNSNLYNNGNQMHATGTIFSAANNRIDPSSTVAVRALQLK